MTKRKATTEGNTANKKRKSKSKEEEEKEEKTNTPSMNLSEEEKKKGYSVKEGCLWRKVPNSKFKALIKRL